MERTGGTDRFSSKLRRGMSLIIAAALMTSCSVGVHNESVPGEDDFPEITITEPVITEPSITEESIPFFPAIKYTTAEPEKGTLEGNRQTINFCRDGQKINGRITIPEGEGPFETIIICGGLYSRMGRYSSKAKSYCNKGFAVIEFDFLNGAPPPDYADPEYIGDFIFEQILDVYAVVDSLKFIQEVDTNSVYLYGHSMGGLVASYVGTLRQDDISGLILVDPSFYASRLMEFEHEETITTDIDHLITFCEIPVVIITGTTGSFGEDPDFFEEELEAFPDCRYVIIDGANHHMDGESGELVVESSVRAIRSWCNKLTLLCIL